MVVDKTSHQQNTDAAPLLAEGFRNVDSQTRDEQRRCVQCLSFIKSDPGFLRVRDMAFDRLALTKAPLTVYDVGCGAGFDTIELAKRVSAGRVVGIDISSALIEEARAKLCAESIRVPVDFFTADARSLTNDPRFLPGSSDRVYMERALQHIPRSSFDEVLRQYYSALKSGGIFVSVEPNWELFTVRSEDVSFFRKLHHHWVDRFNHSDAAMNVPEGMRQAGFINVASEVAAVEFKRFEDGEIVYDFTRTCDELVSNGIAAPEEASAWLKQQRQSGANFYCCLMMSITSGQKP